MTSHDADIIAVLSRLADLLDRLAVSGGTAVSDRGKGRPARVPKKRKPHVSAKDRVTVLRTNYFDPPADDWDGRDGPPPAGGTDIEEWRARKDPDAAFMKRTRRLPMGRKFDG